MPADEQPVRQFFVAVGLHDGRRGPLRYICSVHPSRCRSDGQRPTAGAPRQWIFWIDGGHGVRQFPSVCSRRSRLHHHRCQRVDRQQIPCPTLCTNVAGQGQKSRLHPGDDDAAAQRKERDGRERTDEELIPRRRQFPIHAYIHTSRRKFGHWRGEESWDRIIAGAISWARSLACSMVGWPRNDRDETSHMPEAAKASTKLR